MPVFECLIQFCFLSAYKVESCSCFLFSLFSYLFTWIFKCFFFFCDFPTVSTNLISSRLRLESEKY